MRPGQCYGSLAKERTRRQIGQLLFSDDHAAGKGNSKGEAMTKRDLMELQGEIEESHALITKLEANREPNADALDMLWRVHRSLVARYDRACERLRP